MIRQDLNIPIYNTKLTLIQLEEDDSKNFYTIIGNLFDTEFSLCKDKPIISLNFQDQNYVCQQLIEDKLQVICIFTHPSTTKECVETYNIALHRTAFRINLHLRKNMIMDFILIRHLTEIFYDFFWKKIKHVVI